MTEVSLCLRKRLPLGKSLVYFFVLLVSVNYSTATTVMENILSQLFVFKFPVVLVRRQLWTWTQWRGRSRTL